MLTLALALRCTALPNKLDVHSVARTPNHTNNLRNLLDSKTLWSEYGIDNGITVSFHLWRSAHSALPAKIKPTKLFTANFPRANIYQMISPDLLHQVIKGTFKDHLVAWECDFLIIQHGVHQADIILDDIDRRYVSHFY
jgi:hypothetical protein